MSGLKVVDDTHFTVKLSRPQADFALQLGYIAFYPLPDKAFTDIKAYGAGPARRRPVHAEVARPPGSTTSRSTSCRTRTTTARARRRTAA